MTYRAKKNFASIIPYSVWMAMMMLLPPTGECYAARTLVTAILLFPCLFYLERHHGVIYRNRTLFPELFWGFLVGIVVLVAWVWPEQFEWYREWCIYGDGGTSAIAESDRVLKLVRLVGSAFVISVAEELFFLLYGWLALRKGLLSAIVAHVVTNLALGLYVLETKSWQFW